MDTETYVQPALNPSNRDQSQQSPVIHTPQPSMDNIPSAAHNDDQIIADDIPGSASESVADNPSEQTSEAEQTNNIHGDTTKKSATTIPSPFFLPSTRQNQQIRAGGRRGFLQRPLSTSAFIPFPLLSSRPAAAKDGSGCSSSDEIFGGGLVQRGQLPGEGVRWREIVQKTKVEHTGRIVGEEDEGGKQQHFEVFGCKGC
nr:hypothetical protein Iba_scaffold4346CG0220 [Ipomoea batatas]GME09758.1 hypothetical protein Iba_scaffold9122CG0010 [Ipomoea batatas]GME09761.1 hypothetical protein Iba_scaffold9123CG0010 [Ipomoea batatas]